MTDLLGYINGAASILDIGGVYRTPSSQPDYINDYFGDISDFLSLRDDFITIGSDMWRAFDECDKRSSHYQIPIAFPTERSEREAPVRTPH